MGVKNLMQLI
jgi:5'-3' exonuclease